MPISEVYLIDCVEYMKTIPDKYFSLSICDPPYGINKGGGVDWGTNTITKHKIKDWDKEIPNKDYFDELFRVSKNQIIWGGNYFIGYLKNTPCMIVWDKMNGTNNMADCELAWTSFISPVRKISRHIFTGIGNTNYHLETIHPTQKPVQLYKWLLKITPKQMIKYLILTWVAKVHELPVMMGGLISGGVNLTPITSRQGVIDLRYSKHRESYFKRSLT